MIKKKFSATSRSANQQVVAWLGLAHLRLLWVREGRVAGATWKPVQTGWMRNGELLEPRYLSQALGEALHEMGHPGGGDLIWLLPPELMGLRIGDAPAVDGENLQKALVLEAERIPPERNEPVVLRIGVQASAGGRTQSILGKVFTSTFNLLAKIAEEHKLRLWDIDQAGPALGVRQAAQQQGVEGLWMLLHLEPGNSSLTFFWNQELVRSRSLVDLLDPWARKVKGELGLLEALTGGGALDSSEVMERITQAMEETLARIAQDGLSADLTRAAHDQNLTQLYITGLASVNQDLNDRLIESYGYLFEVERIEAPVEQGALYGPLLAVLDGQRVARFALVGQQQDWSRRLRPALVASAASLAVAGLLSVGGLIYSLSLASQIAGEQARINTLQPEEDRQKALRASVEALETRLEALEALGPVDWWEELQPLLSGLPLNGSVLGVGLNRVGLLNDKEQYRYSLEGAATSRAALESFLQVWERQEGRSVVLGRWARQDTWYEFAATVKARREEARE